MVSRLVKEKGLFEFLEAVKLIKENPKYSKNTTFTLVTIGANYLDNNIITILNNLREKKIIDFIYDAKNIIRIIRKSDCLVNPSYREGLSRSIMESMSQYKPILASNVPGCNNLVKNNYNGFLFKPRSSKSLLKALIKFIDLPSKKKVHMQINSGNFIKNFDERKVIVEYLKILNE
jgi:glycosyltransferase involved in cell wall biosynthesis